MKRHWWRRPTDKAGRWVVAVAGLLGGAFLLVRLIEGQAFFNSFLEAATLDFATMVVGATALALVGGSELEEAEAPGGWRMRFAPARRAVGALQERFDLHQKATDERLLDLEREVFKKESAGSRSQE